MQYCRAYIGHVYVWTTVMLAGCVLGATALAAEDWPQWRGTDRLGVWHESGIIDRFPAGGLKVAWRTPVATLVADISVAAMGSPVVAVTVPRMAPDVCWAAAGVARRRRAEAKAPWIVRRVKTMDLTRFL